MARERLRAMLRHDEGTGPMISGRLMLYCDQCGKQLGTCACAKPGAITGGYGHNFDAKGLSLKAADFLLDEDIDDAIKDLVTFQPWFETVTNEARQIVLIAMMFNLGPQRFAGFRKFIRAAKAEDHETAAVEMLNSKWADEIGDRAIRLAEMWRRGEWLDA
jgi:lysozyme